ncbi:MAG: DegT/DnrJ/EryC1/StrS family aminotransferase [Bacteroidetes bacterium]|nr:DegT/DnrJ/EryC1/StrS family aminotransferase [Bacteroidota bacterium]
MSKIEMVDLIGQYEQIKSEIDSAIHTVIDTGRFIGGPALDSFTKNLAAYLDVNHVVPCANGTDALQIAMMALNLQPGDEVITADFTYAATAEVIALLKLTPVLVEVDPLTFNISPEAIERAITPATKAIVPVHLFGQCADMAPIMEIARKHNLYVIEDTAQAIGAYYTFPDGKKLRAGTIGTIGTTSFFPSKNLGCYGDGGAIFTNDEALARHLKMIANHGQSSQYVFDEIGCNSRLDNLQAAILDVKLKYLDKYCEARQQAAAYYDTQLAGLKNATVPVRAVNSTHVFHQYTLTLKAGTDRAAVRKAFEERGIPTMVYYPSPMHRQNAYKSPRYSDTDFPISIRLSECVLSLPIHTEMTKEQQEYIISAAKEIIQ